MSTVVWTGIAAGTMTDLQERKLYGARVDLYGAAIVVYWTADGTTGGASLFSSTRMPMVEVMIADPSNAQAWTNNGNWGPMLRQDMLTNMAPYAWTTVWDSTNSFWYTVISQGSIYEGTGIHTLVGAGTVNSKRPAFIYAMGT
jgi:hypothetical protein